METTLKFKIFNYEKKIHEEYLHNREIFLKNLEQIETNKLDQRQLLVFINDIKSIIDPIKSTISFIQHFNELKFDDTEILDMNNFITFYLLFGNNFFGTGRSELSDETLETSSELSDSSELSSE